MLLGYIVDYTDFIRAICRTKLLVFSQISDIFDKFKFR